MWFQYLLFDHFRFHFWTCASLVILPLRTVYILDVQQHNCCWLKKKRERTQNREFSAVTDSWTVPQAGIPRYTGTCGEADFEGQFPKQPSPHASVQREMLALRLGTDFVFLFEVSCLGFLFLSSFIRFTSHKTIAGPMRANCARKVGFLQRRSASCEPTLHVKWLRKCSINPDNFPMLLTDFERCKPSKVKHTYFYCGTLYMHIPCASDLIHIWPELLVFYLNWEMHYLHTLKLNAKDSNHMRTLIWKERGPPCE